MSSGLNRTQFTLTLGLFPRANLVVIVRPASIVYSEPLAALSVHRCPISATDGALDGRGYATMYRIETEGEVTTGNSNRGRQPKVPVVRSSRPVISI